LNEIYLNNPASDFIILENKGINDMTPLLTMLSKFEKLKSLDLKNNNIRVLPSTLNMLPYLATLDLSDNPLEQMQDVCNALSKLESLTELNINIENSDEVDLIREELPHLQILNGYPLYEDSQGDDDNN